MRPRVRSALVSFSRLREYADSHVARISGRYLFA
jgi:hypothetical protein